jgi:GTP-binding protein Era
METYCGYIGLIGRPNVGKSTLLNHLLAKKISITSRKPQTTRHRILGIRHEENYQFVFVDTPGIHQGRSQLLNKMMNQTAKACLTDVDVILWLIDATRWTPDDDLVLKNLKTLDIPCILVINKVDKLADPSLLLPKMQEWQHLLPFAAMIPVSAKTGKQLPALLDLLKPYLPQSPHFFYPDQVTDRDIKFQLSEILREKVFRFSGEELPYATTVEIEAISEEDKMWRIHALIWVDKESHKRMLIGSKGEKLKLIATEARQNMEKLLDKKVFLQCFCKVKGGWAEDRRFLREMGLDD